MISALKLERPGAWRAVLLTVIFAIVFAPILPLLISTTGFQNTLGTSFYSSLASSLKIALIVAALSVIIGAPTGVLSALWHFRGKTVLLSFLALPFLVPSFLWSIGFTNLGWNWIVDFPMISTAFSFLGFGISLTFFVTYSAIRNLSKGQVQSALIVGGHRAVFYFTLKSVLSIATVASILASILTLSDSGPPQIFGISVASREILISFSALYDFNLAVRQCLVLAGFVLVLVAPILIWSAPRISNELFSRDVRFEGLLKSRQISLIGPIILTGLAGFFVFLPLTGLVFTGFKKDLIVKALLELVRTANNTLVYGIGSGILATSFSLAIVLAVGRIARLRLIVTLCIMLFFAIPPLLSTLGWIAFSTHASASTDFLIRSRFSVILMLALRFIPISTIILMRSYGSTTPTWAQVASVHGVSIAGFKWNVLIPRLFSSLMISTLCVSLLATAEVGMVLLLRPPGEDSYPVSIFTIMANAPEGLTAALCLVYCCVVILGFAAIFSISSFFKKRRIIYD